MELEDLITGFSLDVINPGLFLVNALLTVLLTWILTLFYNRYAKSISNRSVFSSNFILLALTTMLIITIVKSSIALSLGLVGALSIVRFRTAIKEPEELVYLFFTISIGLGMGANQTAITVLAFFLIMAILIIKTIVSKEKPTLKTMHLNLTTTENLDSINTVLEKHFKEIDLIRLHQKGTVQHLNYYISNNSLKNTIESKNELLQIDPSMEISFIDTANIGG